MASPCLIASRYRLVERIGCGGMGSVFRAHDEVDARDVAVKLIAEHLSADELAVRRFKRETAICARLRHPNIVLGLDGGYDDGSERHFIVMELVDGDDAGRLAERRDELSVTDIVGVVTQVCDALAYAHEQEIVHGDVSPGNILIRRSDRTAKLTDFGLARARWATRPETPGRVAGTPGYLAPEVADGYSATPLSDLYSLGSVAHRLITAASPELYRDDVPRVVSLAIERALLADPGSRHASVAEFREELSPSRLVCAA
jgi:eukaryotic-like serine/threonine-protein kinase